MIKKILLLSIAVLTLAACSKEGERGPRGYDGLNGRDGLNGSTPQLFPFDIPVRDFSMQTYYEDASQLYNNAWVALGNINGMTINENDLVMVFMHQTTDGGPDNYFQALPYNDYFDGTNNFNHYSYGILDNNGDILFSIRRNDGTQPFDDMNASWTIQYNVYVLKGTAGRKAKLPQGIQTEKELRTFYNIQPNKAQKGQVHSFEKDFLH